jgi:hypothetical protein
VASPPPWQHSGFSVPPFSPLPLSSSAVSFLHPSLFGGKRFTQLSSLTDSLLRCGDLNTPSPQWFVTSPPNPPLAALADAAPLSLPGAPPTQATGLRPGAGLRRRHHRAPVRPVRAHQRALRHAAATANRWRRRRRRRRGRQAPPPPCDCCKTGGCVRCRMCVSLQVSDRASHWPGAAAQPQRTNRLRTLPRAGEGREGPLPPPKQPRAAGLRSPSCGKGQRRRACTHALTSQGSNRHVGPRMRPAEHEAEKIKSRLLSSPGLIQLSGWGSARKPRSNQNACPYPKPGPTRGPTPRSLGSPMHAGAASGPQAREHAATNSRVHAAGGVVPD